LAASARNPTHESKIKRLANMRLEKTYLKPKLGTFVKYFTFFIVSFWALGTLINIIASTNPFELKLFGGWGSYLFSAVALSVGLTMGTRRFELVIADPNDLVKAKEWTLEFLTKNGLTVKHKNEVETTLESTKSYNRLFNSWFGTELISVKRTDNRVIVAGPFRLVDRLADSVDLKLRFGKSVD
jgi:polar amino acid transport system substrate-binding protein